jgi:iron complex outermembrane receptor protein
MNVRAILLAATALTASGASEVAWAQAAPGAQQAPTPTTSPQEQKQAGAPAQVGEIIVTARRRSEALSRVPVAVTAFDADAMIRRQIVDTHSLTEVTPGFNFRLQGARTAPILEIRGQTRATGGGGTPGVLVYMNDVPLPTYGTFIPTFDMANVQVLKGPQGTLFGRNAIGGAVLLNSVAPTHQFGGYLDGSLGNYANKRFEGAVNLPVVKDVLSVRLAGQYDYEGSFTKTAYFSNFTVDANGVATPGQPTTGHPVDEFLTKALRASVLFEPTTGVRNVLVADWTYIKGTPNNYFASLSEPRSLFLSPPSVISGVFQSEGIPPPVSDLFAQNLFNLLQCPSRQINCNIDAALAAQQANPRTNYRNSTADSWVKLWGVSNTTTIDVTPKITLKNIFGYRHIDNFGSQDVDATGIEYLEAVVLSNYRSWSEEIQLSGNLAERLKFVLGGFFYDTAPTGTGGQESSHVLLFGGFLNQSEAHYIEDKSRAVYGQIDYDLSDFVHGLSATAGYRQTWDESKGCIASWSYFPFAGPGASQFGYIPTYSQCRAESFPDQPVDAMPIIAHSYDVNFKKGTYTLSLNWQATPGTLVYVAHRRGYRGGGFNFGNVPTPNFDPSLQFYGPETLTDFEVGLKTRFQAAEVRGAFDLAVFTGKDQGYQFQVASTGVCVPPGSTTCLPLAGLILNVADLRISGFEADGSLTYSGLTFGTNFAYTKVDVARAYLPEGFIKAYTDAFGANPPLPQISVSDTPRWQVNGNVAYDFPNPVFDGTLSFNLDVHHQTSYLTTNLVVPGYTTVDSQLILANPRGLPIDVRLFVRNLLDATYFSGSSSNAASTGIFTYVKAPPRMYGIAVRYRFGEG